MDLESPCAQGGAIGGAVESYATEDTEDDGGGED